MINMPNKLIEVSYYVPNKLINASYNMPLSAMRLRTLALSKLEPLSYLFGISNPVTIFASEWQEIFIESENPYRDIKRAASAFSKAMVQFEGKKEPIKFLERVVYESGKGRVKLYFNPEFLVSCL